MVSGPWTSGGPKRRNKVLFSPDVPEVSIEKGEKLFSVF